MGNSSIHLLEPIKQNYSRQINQSTRSNLVLEEKYANVRALGVTFEVMMYLLQNLVELVQL
jgi:hypothetical protein